MSILTTTTITTATTSDDTIQSLGCDESTNTGNNTNNNDNKNLGVLNWQQVNKLDSLLNKPIPIHGRGTYPTLVVRLKDFIRNLNKRLVEQRVRVRDIRINGGVASYVLARQDDYEFSDIDIIFSCDLLQLNEPFTNSSSEILSPEAAFSNCCDIIKQTVFECLLDYFPSNNKEKINPQILKDAYVKKMVKIYQQSSQNTSSKENINNSMTNLNESDLESAESMQSSSRWSLISLYNNQGQNIELKFVDKMKRQFQFSVDAFQIHLTSLLKYYDLSYADVSQQTMNENIYPTVIAESMYGEFDEANFHLNEKLIATKSPEEIRGGGLLKYCNLLVRGYKPVNGAESQMNTMEKYMCSRFFIDFSDLADQEHKLNAYLDCHFQNAPQMCVLYLKKLYEVVNSSTVCLMGHERKQTLNLIDSLAKRYHQQAASEDPTNEQNDNDSESVNSDSSSLSSSSSSLSHQLQRQHQKPHHFNNYHHHNHHNQPQRIHNNRNNRLNHNNYNNRSNTSLNAMSPSSPSSSVLFDSTNINNYGRSPPNDLNYSNQMYYINYSKYKQNQHHQQLYQQHSQQYYQQQQTSQALVTSNSSNKLTIPCSSSSSLSSSSSSVVSSPSPSPPLTATPTTAATATTNIPFYITISTPTPQEENQEEDDEVEDEYEYDENENNMPNDNSNSSTNKSTTTNTTSITATTPTSVFQCKIPTQYYPLIEVFNYYSPPVITTPPTVPTPLPPCSSSNASSPVYFYTDPSNSSQEMTFTNNIITRILPSKSYQYCCSSPTYEYHNYMSSIHHFQQLQLQQQPSPTSASPSPPPPPTPSSQSERIDLTVQ